MSAAESRKQQIERELASAIRASGRAHAMVAKLSRRPRIDRRSLRALSRAAMRATLANGRVAGFANLLATT